MIFVTVGTHPGQFDRLIRRIDKIAPKIKEKIIIQRGFTKYTPKNVEFFEFTENIHTYYKKARLVIAQSATSLVEFSLKYNKLVITVPRQKKYGEHINDHQLEFGEYFSKKTAILMIKNIDQLTPELLKSYSKKARIDSVGLKNLQKIIIGLIGDNR